MSAARSLIFLSLIGSLLSLRADTGRLRVYPNTSITIDAITEAPDGFLWLATGNGVFRFDGFHYQRLHGIPFGASRLLGVTRDGSVWIGGSEGLARCHKECKVLFTDQVWSLVPFPDKIIVTTGGQMIRIRLDGSMLSRENTDITGSKYILEAPGSAVAMPGATLRLFDADTLNERTGMPLPEHLAQAAVDSRGRVWAGDKHRIDLLGSPGTHRRYERDTKESDAHQSLFTGRNGEVWFAGSTITGLSTGREYHDSTQYDRYLATAIYEDKRGHLWVAKEGLGLMEWTPDPWQRWPASTFGPDSPGQVVQTPDGTVIAVGRKLYRHTEHDDWTALSQKDQHYYFVLPLSAGGFMAAIRDLGLARLSPSGEPLGSVPSQLANRTSYRVILEDRKGRVWSGNKIALQRLDSPTGSLRIIPLPNADLSLSNAVDAELDANGRVWMGYERGLAWLDEYDKWHQIPTNASVGEIRSFTLADSHGDDIWVAHRTQGRFSRLQRKGDIWNVTRFDEEAGYGPPVTNFIKRDSRGWIWRGSTDGVHISDGTHVKPEDWLHINSANGLGSDETDQYGFLEDRDGSVWITGDQGLTHLRPDPAWFSSAATLPPPRISRVQIDRNSYPGSEFIPPEALKQAGEMTIDVGSLSASPFRSAPFRYRLKPRSDAWMLSSNGAIEFHDLRPQTYTLEVAYTGASSAVPLIWNFRIGSPPSPAWLWLLTLPCMTLAAWLFRDRPVMESIRFRAERLTFIVRRRLFPRSMIVAGPKEQMPDRTGELMAGRYKLVDPISRGGFSVVHSARDLTTSEIVAVKIVSQELGNEAWLRERFAHEVAALNSVRHPNIVPILDSWIGSDGSPCLVMPLLNGPTLAAVLTLGPLDIPRVARIIRAISSALAAIHSRGIVHRDLKPDNVVLTSPGGPDETPILIDFGTAGLRGALGQTSITTVLAGSFHYMAPERLVGQYSAASDAYSFGVIILEMITGKRLGDIGALATEPSFETELALALKPYLGKSDVPAAVRHLAALFSPSPEKRPEDIDRWGSRMAGLIEPTQA